ncbi:MAG: ATP-binding protein [Spartobacteria bacterium]
MTLAFTNRVRELEDLDATTKSGGLAVLFGRRRVGKTRLLTHWLAQRGGYYSQAIEAAVPMQIEQTARDIGPALPAGIQPKTWMEFFELLRYGPAGTVLCLDEFPYLVASDASLPSVVQRWLDHHRPEGFTLVLSGSSTGAMNDCFLNRSAPLYQRARKLIHLEPMDYAAFCGACALDRSSIDSFTRYALVGGIPKYWEFVEAGATALDLAEELFFGRSAFLEDEPLRILREEGIAGLAPLSVLEAVGRGACKTSEIAARLGTAQTNLGRTLQQLLDASLLEREIPYGESLRTTKKTLYRIIDPALRFWFRVYSPHRSLWRRLPLEEKTKLLHDHAATVFEDYCRSWHPEAARYWEAGAEFDFIRKDGDGVVVSEVKFKKLTATEKTGLKKQLAEKWMSSTASHKHPGAEFEILDTSALKG